MAAGAPPSVPRALALLERVAEVGRLEPDPHVALAEVLERLRAGLGADCAVVLLPRAADGRGSGARVGR